MKELPEHSRELLISALKTGTEAAYQQLFDLYGKRLYRFAEGYLNDPVEAEEIVQEVFIKIWSVREQLSTIKSFDSYIFTIAKNAILNSIRKAKSKAAYATWAMLHPGKDILLDDELDFNELQKAYRCSVETLSPKRQEVFCLSRDTGLTNREIAEKLGISEKTVENHMTAALAEIRRYLQGSGFSGKMFFELFF